jgi:hypothetical protein
MAGVYIRCVTALSIKHWRLGSPPSISIRLLMLTRKRPGPHAGDGDVIEEPGLTPALSLRPQMDWKFETRLHEIPLAEELLIVAHPEAKVRSA